MSKKKDIKDYFKSKSFWLDTSEEELKPRPSLAKSISTDIAILGGGYTGLWIAYYLKNKHPELNIVILEKEVVGFGASGRNGGWCSPKFPITPPEMIKRFGHDVAKQLNLEMFETVKEIGRVIKKESFEVDWKLGGSLEVTRASHKIPLLEQKMNIYKSIGIENEFQILSTEKTNDRVRIHGVEGSLYTKTSAVLNPAKLVRQLAKTLENSGVSIYEQTEVLEYKKGGVKKSPCFITHQGTVTAKHAIVISGESYLSQFKSLRRSILPMYSLITLTEPLSKTDWEYIGWHERESVGSTRLSVEYLQKTEDGRILFGGRGQPYRFGSKISDSLDYHRKTDEMLKKRIKEWFPSLSNVKFSHSWGGPVGVTRDWAPNLFFNKSTRIAGAWGFAGQGVATSNLAGRIISGLLLEEDNQFTSLPIVNEISRKWEIEPFRWIGARYVQRGLEKVDRRSELKGKIPDGKTFAERLAKH